LRLQLPLSPLRVAGKGDETVTLKGCPPRADVFWRGGRKKYFHLFTLLSGEVKIPKGQKRDFYDD